MLGCGKDYFVIKRLLRQVAPILWVLTLLICGNKRQKRPAEADGWTFILPHFYKTFVVYSVFSS